MASGIVTTMVGGSGRALALPEPVEKAKTLREAGKFSEALEGLESFLQQLTPTQRQERIAALNEQSQCLWRSGKLAEAESQAQTARDLAAQQPPSLQGQGEALNNLGTIYEMRGDLARAEEYYQRSLTLFETLGNPEDIAGPLNNLGTIYWRCGDLTRAEEHYKKSLDLFEQVGNTQNIAGCLNNLGLICRRCGDLDRAEEHYQHSLALSEPLGNPEDIGNILNNLGNVYKMRGDLDRAEEHYQRSLALRKQVGNPDDIAGSLNNLGKIYRLRGDLDRAEECFQRSLALREPLGNPNSIAYVLNSLGQVYELRGDLSLAEDYFQQCLDLREQVGNPQDIAEACCQLVWVLPVQESKGKVQAHLDRLAQLAQTSGLPDVTVKHLLATSHFKLIQLDLSQALDAATEAKALAAESPNFALLVEANKLLVQIHLQKYLLARTADHKTQVEALLAELEQMCKRGRLHGAYVETVLMQGFLKRATFDLPGAIKKFELTELLAEERNILPVAQKARTELEQLRGQWVMLQKLMTQDPEAFERAQLQEMISYIQIAKTYLE